MKNTLILFAAKRAALFCALLVLPIFANAQNPDSKAISDLLSQARQHAVLAENDAVTLASYTNSRLSWHTHARRLQEMKDHANDLINEANKLNSLRDQGSPWQQHAIDQINPLLHEMADTLTATIQHLNENPARVHMPPYQDYAKASSDAVIRIAKLISDFAEFDEAKSKAAGLEKALNLPTIADNQ